MSLRVRRMTAQDVDECLRLARNRPFYQERYGARTPESVSRVLRRLLQTPSVNGGVVEDLAKCSGERILSVGCTAFVQPGWVAQYLADPFPFAGSYILESCMHGRDLTLSGAQLRQGNCSNEGLSAVLLTMSWDESLLLRSDFLEVQTKAIESFLMCHKGFRVAQLLHEVTPGFEESLFLRGGAWVERSRYLKHYPLGNGPILVGMTKEELLLPAHATSPLAPLFVWRDFRLCFTPDQQRVLALVLAHHSDNSIAQQLGIGAEAVGRRMQRIYRRVEIYQDALDPVFPQHMHRSDRRKFLMDYLRVNPHEVLPHAAHTSRSRQP